MLGRWLTPLSTVLSMLVTTLVAAVAGLAVVGPAGPAAAADPLPTTLTITAPARYADRPTDVVATLTTSADGAPVAGVPVLLERYVGGTWTTLATPVTDEAGSVVVEAVLARSRPDNVFRASFAGDATYAASGSPAYQAPLLKRTSRVRVEGPERVADGEQVRLRVVWRTGAGEPVPGKVALQRKVRGGPWRLHREVITRRDGRTEVVVRPRVDTAWRAVARGNAWTERGTSPVHRVDNVPPGERVVLPAGAPRPRVPLPPQPRATGVGPQLQVTRIPDGVWRSMVGRSWHPGCPVGRAGLRLVRVNYFGYDGYRYRGEVVAAASAAGRIGGALAAMHERRFPIRSMYRVDRFGWSGRLQGADDYRSMAAGNTSAFNCRWVVGRPGVRSPHSYGRSLDVNPWENPYRASHGWTPNSWWVGRSHPRVAWRSRDHAVVRLMAAHGLRWTYGTFDAHHFDARTASGRALPGPVARACGTVVCH
ncbi:M15 family metallopeptidase [Nocardioides sp. SOB77]|uniref:M15 family metallopeptidase n=1 Tax=Nocardioides oceani TaxID=3058369 RepID=A0ABT8FD72_9ACTN|nr:M15 family metallopeptidase [Nocardioides oceani]MDN4172510.1 M15 family metallopeptidase [Nocardioides oceani]